MGFQRRLYRVLHFAGLGADTDPRLWKSLPEANYLRELLEAERYYRLATELEQMKQRGGDAYTLALAALADWDGEARELNWWVSQAAHLGEAWLVRGVYSVCSAREAFALRGGHLSVTGLSRFFRQLERAQEDLAEAAQRLPERPEPYVWRQAAALVLGSDEQEIKSHYGAVMERDRNNFEAHLTRLRALGGSDAEHVKRVLDFAREISDGAGRGSPLHALVAAAHVENWAWRLYCESPDAAREALAAWEVRAELVASYERSVGSAQFASDYLVPYYAGIFAMAFFLCDEKEYARDAMKKIGDCATTYPWAYLKREPREFADPGFVVDRVRRILSA